MNETDRYWDCLDLAMEASHGGRTDEALAWLDEALKARPGGAEAHNGRGEILWHAHALGIIFGQFELGLDVALFGGQTVQPGGLRWILLDALALGVEPRQAVLRPHVAVFRERGPYFNRRA
jgi:hypothetical protein